MRTILKSCAVHALGAANAFPTGMTDPARICALLQRLRPLAGPPLIRLGPAGDGGYLVPDDLDGISACFSPGVSSVSGFERDCAERGMDVFLADRSVQGPAEAHPRFRFVPLFVGATSDDEFITLDDWVAGSGVAPAAELLLQIDIEGFEFETFFAATDRLMRRFRIIVAEFHRLDQLWSNPFFAIASRVFDKILKTHACVHLHPNNRAPSLRKDCLEIPWLMEATFLRRDRLAADAGFATTFPHPLDHDNTSLRPMPLAPCWYGEGNVQPARKALAATF